MGVQSPFLRIMCLSILSFPAGLIYFLLLNGVIEVYYVSGPIFSRIFQGHFGALIISIGIHKF